MEPGSALNFVIRGEPTPKARPGHFFNKKTGIMHGYIPAKQRKAEADVRAQIVAQLPPNFVMFKRGQPVRMTINIFRQKPASLPKKVLWPATRPDLDNYAKLYVDAMNSVVFEDDAAIVELTLSKKFADSMVGAVITLEAI